MMPSTLEPISTLFHTTTDHDDNIAAILTRTGHTNFEPASEARPPPTGLAHEGQAA
jgi:hypothetical protein